MACVEMRAGDLRAVVHDGEGGLSGVRSLVHRGQGDDVFYEGMGGLNFEYIFDGVQPEGEVFEPRQAPMVLESVEK